MRTLVTKVWSRSLTAALFALSLPGPAHSGDDPGSLPLKPGDRIRIEGAHGAKLAGIISLTSAKVATRGKLVQNDSRLVAVAVPEQAEPWCLPRPGELVAGRLVEADDESIVLTVNGRQTPYRIPWRAVASIERNTRESSRGRGARTGLLVGAAAGVLLGAAVGSDDAFGPTKAGAAAIGGTAFGLIGLAVGAAAGDGGRWEKLPKPRAALSVAPSPRGLGLTAAISF